jgi:hypothetical protein
MSITGYNLASKQQYFHYFARISCVRIMRQHTHTRLELRMCVSVYTFARCYQGNCDHNTAALCVSVHEQVPRVCILCLQISPTKSTDLFRPQWRRRPTSGMDYSDISINSTQKAKLARLQHVNSICRGKVGVEEGEGAGHTAHMHAAPTTSKVDHAHKSNHRRSETSARSCSR